MMNWQKCVQNLVKASENACKSEGKAYLLLNTPTLIPLTWFFLINFNLTNNCIISSLSELICTPLYLRPIAVSCKMVARNLNASYSNAIQDCNWKWASEHKWLQTGEAHINKQTFKYDHIVIIRDWKKIIINELIERSSSQQTIFQLLMAI